MTDPAPSRRPGAADLDLGETLRGFGPGQKVFAHFRLVRLLGRGGMGVVWLARDEQLERDVALKFLPEIVARDPVAINDLKREARRSLELAHPHIVRLNAFLEDDRATAVAMEFVEGPTLAARRLELPGQVFSVAELGPLVAQLCAALDYAHGEARVVHRDLKPANLMLDRRGRLKVADFGIARGLSDSVSRVSAQMSTAGTPFYMSPQQMMGDDPSAADDVYALGATLYELLTGKPPFYTGNVLLQVKEKVAPSLADRRRALDVVGEPIPGVWEETIAACLAKEPKDRPASAGEVAERLGLGAADGGSAQRATLNAQRPSGEQSAAPAKVEGEVPTAPARSGVQSVEKKPAAPWGPLWAGLAVAVIVLAGGGYYFGVHAPEQRKIELARLEAQRKESERLATARGGMIIRTEPAGAEVRVGGVGIETSPATLKEMRLGAYEVTLSKAGYETQMLKLGVEENRFTEPAAIVLKPSVGSAVLTSDPAGLDYELVSTRLVVAELAPVRRAGKTPATLGDLPLGEYAVTVRREGWPEKRGTLQIERGAEGKWAADFAGGGLAITSTPAGLEYEIVPARGVTEGIKYARMTGKTPATLEDLPLGEYAVTVKRASWVAESSRVRVARSATATMAAPMAGGELKILSEPAGAEWKIVDGPARAALEVASGRTPAELKDLPPGKYAVEQQRSGGWAAQQRAIEVKAGEVTTTQAQFPSGTLEITSTPSGAEVYAEGKKIGVTPLSYRDLRPSTYAYEFRSEGYKPAGLRGEIKPGETARAAAVLERQALPVIGQASTIPDLNLTLMPIAAGTFTMGDASDGPAHPVTLTRPYWLGKTEVTQEAWEAVMGSNPSNFKGKNLPVENISWTEAVEFCRKLTERERAAGGLRQGYAYTLPTEAQWEYACRAGTTGDYAGELGAMAWYGQNSGNKTNPVGTKRANGWGLHDMHGNVSEWCADWNAGYASGSVRDPLGPSLGSSRVSRGGGWWYSADYCRSAYRGKDAPGNRLPYIGFRLALSSVP